MVSEIETRYADEISDDISIASTASSDQQSDYELETILADRTKNGNKEYLVKWANYHTLKSSWEPEENLNQEETLLEWEAKKAKIGRGELSAFDIEKFERAQARAKARSRAHGKDPNRVLKAHTKQDEIRSRATHQELTNLLFSDNSDCEPESETTNLVESPVQTTRTPGARSEAEHFDFPDSSSSLFVPRETPPQATTTTTRPSSTNDPGPSAASPVASSNRVSFTFHHAPKGPKGPLGSKPTRKKALSPKSPPPRPFLASFAPEPAPRKPGWDSRSRDTIPDVNQLELRKPSDFPARAGDSHAMTISSTEDPPLGTNTSATSPSGQTSSETVQSVPQRAPRRSRWDTLPDHTAPDTSQSGSRSSSNGPPRTNDKRPAPMAPPPTIPNPPNAERRVRSPGPYRDRDTSPRRGDGRRPGLERRPRSPDAYSRRESYPRSENLEDPPSHWDSYRPNNSIRSEASRREPDSYRPPVLSPSRRRSSSPPSSSYPRRPPPTSNDEIHDSPRAPDRSNSTQSDPVHPDRRPNLPPTASANSRDSTQPAQGHPDQRPPLPQPTPAISRDQSEIFAADQIARMPVRAPLPGAVFTGNGYFFNPGEILAHVTFGPDKRPIGPVRLRGANPKAKIDLLASKPKRKENFEMWFKATCTEEEYDYLCQGTRNTWWCNAWMEGFRDTNEPLFYMADYLRRNNVLAIYYPPHNQGNVWVAYSPKCTQFDFLTKEGSAIPDGVPIRLAVRSPLTPFEALSSRPQPPDFRTPQFAASTSLGLRISAPTARLEPSMQSPSDHVPSPVTQTPISGAHAQNQRPEAEPRVSGPARQPTTQVSDPRLRRRESLNATQPPPPKRQETALGQTPKQSPRVEPRQLSRAKPGVSEDLSARGDDGLTSMDIPMDLEPDNSQPVTQPREAAPVPTEPTSQPLEDTDAVLLHFFHRKLLMSVEELATLHSTRDFSSADMFYLYFPQDETGQVELQLMEKWLKLHDKMIWSNRNPSDWMKFFKNSKRGVVVFHESMLEGVEKLRPSIGHLLWNPLMNFWVVRLSAPLEIPYPQPGDDNTHFQALFRSGGTYLITEDVFQDLRRVAMLICWFHSHQKANPGQYKLVLFPNVMDVLERRIEDHQQSPENINLLITILVWIKKINSVDTSFPHFDPDSLDPRNLDRPNNNIVCFPLPRYGHRTEDDNAAIPKGLTQAERNADHLVETYAGWAFMHAPVYRRHIVITTMKTERLLERWKSWGHLSILSVSSFFRTWKLSEETLLARLHKGDARAPPSGSSSPTVPLSLPAQAHPNQPPQAPSQSPRTSTPPRNPGQGPSDEAFLRQNPQWRAPSRQSPLRREK